MKQIVGCSKLDLKQRKWKLIGSKNSLQQPRNHLGVLTTELRYQGCEYPVAPIRENGKMGAKTPS